MYISPEELIIFYHAIRSKYVDRVEQLTEQFTTKYGGQKVLKTRPPNPYSNYFFCIDDVVGLCVEDTLMTRKAAAEYDISDHIYFGPNSDPLSVEQILTVEQVSTLMPDIRQWYGDKISDNIPDMTVLRLRG